MRVPFVVIGGGLSGLAAAIRAARFDSHVLLLEKHSRIGGLNSYFYRNKLLYEVGLHAITNYANPEEKQAPLNRLLRQLKIRRKDLTFCQQYQSKIVFRDQATLKFSNNSNLLQDEIGDKFPLAIDQWQNLVKLLHTIDPFIARPFRSTKKFLHEVLNDPLLIDMLLCPLMFYGSSCQEDMDLSQFAIMFRAIYQEGMFRPYGSIKDFLDLLVAHYLELGGTLRKSCNVKEIIHRKGKAHGVVLDCGEMIECDYILSTIGHVETLNLLGQGDSLAISATDRLSFVENIYLLPSDTVQALPQDTTIIFYNDGGQFCYKKPDDFVDFSSAVICFPDNFQGIKVRNNREIRSTHLANYAKWKRLSGNMEQYREHKKAMSRRSQQCLEGVIGNFKDNIVFENSFTPVTIERYTSKIDGAIYGSPVKIKEGNIGFTNLFLAGTDQGFLGIVGSMLSGISIVNQHILSKL